MLIKICKLEERNKQATLLALFSYCALTLQTSNTNQYSIERKEAIAKFRFGCMIDYLRNYVPFNFI
jgi:hypothetical protein